MPRGPRLDGPETLHHVTVRGLERHAIFRDDRDRRRFLDRLENVVATTGLTVLAWALLPNHAHLLVRTPRPRPGSPYRPLLSTAMRRLLTAYAGDFNRRYRRSGHVFQNRYKSILIETEPYLLELVRYVHLNPLRAGLVRDLAALAAYRWSGHTAILGIHPRPWQAVNEVLGQFGRKSGEARRRYCGFVAAGGAMGHRPDLQGGGLRRSAGGWAGLASLRRGRERWAADERILGGGPFVEAVRAELVRDPAPWPPARATAALTALVEQVASLWNLPLSALKGSARRQPIPAARAAVSNLAVIHLGLSAAAVARTLGISRQAVLQAIPRGDAILAVREGQVRALLRNLRREFS